MLHNGLDPCLVSLAERRRPSARPTGALDVAFPCQKAAVTNDAPYVSPLSAVVGFCISS